MEGWIFVGHEPFHLRAPQNAQIGGLFLGQRCAIWRLWWAMLGYVEAILGGLADGGVDFCRATNPFTFEPRKMPRSGDCSWPLLGHLEAMVGHVGLC